MCFSRILSYLHLILWTLIFLQLTVGWIVHGIPCVVLELRAGACCIAGIAAVTGGLQGGTPMQSQQQHSAA